VDRLEARWVRAGEIGHDLLELDARTGRIGVGVNDPDEIGLIWVIQLTGNFDRDPLVRTGREAIDIADQRYHGLSPSRIQRFRPSSR
jgi:hypothetical protein